MFDRNLGNEGGKGVQQYLGWFGRIEKFVYIVWYLELEVTRNDNLFSLDTEFDDMTLTTSINIVVQGPCLKEDSKYSRRGTSSSK